MANKGLTIREKRKQQLKRQRLMTILAVVFVAVVVVGILIAPSIQRTLAPIGEFVIPEPVSVPNPSRNAMGDPNAPVKIIEYSDFQCPACKQFHELTMPDMIENYVEPGQVFFEYRSMGFWIGPESVRAAEATYCAADQERFWDYHNILFENQGLENSNNYSDKRLVAFAEALNLDMETFIACLDDRKYEDELNQDRIDGQALGVDGTPSFLINGILYKGSLPFSSLQDAIESALTSVPAESTP
jgi:protein-disulfide isomerase